MSETQKDTSCLLGPPPYPAILSRQPISPVFLRGKRCNRLVAPACPPCPRSSCLPSLLHCPLSWTPTPAFLLVPLPQSSLPSISLPVHLSATTTSFLEHTPGLALQTLVAGGGGAHNPGIKCKPPEMLHAALCSLGLLTSGLQCNQGPAHSPTCSVCPAPRRSPKRACCIEDKTLWPLDCLPLLLSV